MRYKEHKANVDRRTAEDMFISIINSGVTGTSILVFLLGGQYFQFKVGVGRNITSPVKPSCAVSSDLSND